MDTARDRFAVSTPIQRHLHQQTEDTKNENDNGVPLDRSPLIGTRFHASSSLIEVDCGGEQ
jgi:hypothetical protein